MNDVEFSNKHACAAQAGGAEVVSQPGKRSSTLFSILPYLKYKNEYRAATLPVMRMHREKAQTQNAKRLNCAGS